MPDQQDVPARGARDRPPPTPGSSRAVRLVGEVLRAEDRLMEPLDEVHATGARTAKKRAGPLPGSQSRKSTIATAKHAETQQINADAGQRRRERRYQRARAGWLASRMRAGARERWRGKDEGQSRE
jgi:hypothetical protein